MLTDAELWEDLIVAIEEGQVVPMVGRDLLTVESDGGTQFFHNVVARRLASEMKVPIEGLPQDFDANDVICAHEDFHGDPMAINPKVVRILRNLKVAPPEPLRLLAEIPNFRLFVSTTFDTLLEDAITLVRGRPPAVVAFPSATEVKDFDEELLERQGSMVFHILGRVSASSSFVVTEGQVLEQMHNVMASPSRPERLIARLRESHLLMLGVSFPDWLARFLLRLARGKPLWDSRPMMEIIADSKHCNQAFSVFLRHFSPQQSRLFSGGSPVDFVRELHRRWFERHPIAVPRSDDVASNAEKPGEMARGSIFISYASEDRTAAFQLADQLAAAGLEAWVDRRLNPGDEYRSIIERHIRECCAFVPVLSRNTQPDDERWFRKEWAQACERARSYFGTARGFLYPVVVDATPLGELSELRLEIFGRSAARALAGTPPPELVEQLDRSQKAWRKQFAHA